MRPIRAATPGAGCMSFTPTTGPCATPARRTAGRQRIAIRSPILRDRGDMVEGEYRWAVRKTSGASGCSATPTTPTRAAIVRRSAAQADRQPPGYRGDPQSRNAQVWVGIQRGPGTDQDVGLFGRLGWNDGKTESFAFTAIDRSGDRRHLRHRRALAPLFRYGCDPSSPRADCPPSTPSISPWAATIF